MDHYSYEGSNIREHSRTMSLGCARITKPPYTPPRGTCLFVNLLIRLRVTNNKCMSFLRTNVSIRKLTLPPPIFFYPLRYHALPFLTTRVGAYFAGASKPLARYALSS